MNIGGLIGTIIGLIVCAVIVYIIFEIKRRRERNRVVRALIEDIDTCDDEPQVALYDNLL